MFPRRFVPFAVKATLAIVPSGSAAEALIVIFAGTPKIEFCAGAVMAMIGRALVGAARTAESERSKLQPELPALPWWISTASEFNPARSNDVLTEALCH